MSRAVSTPDTNHGTGAERLLVSTTAQRDPWPRSEQWRCMPRAVAVDCPVSRCVSEEHDAERAVPGERTGCLGARGDLDAVVELASERVSSPG